MALPAATTEICEGFRELWDSVSTLEGNLEGFRIKIRSLEANCFRNSSSERSAQLANEQTFTERQSKHVKGDAELLPMPQTANLETTVAPAILPHKQVEMSLDDVEAEVRPVPVFEPSEVHTTGNSRRNSNTRGRISEVRGKGLCLARSSTHSNLAVTKSALRGVFSPHHPLRVLWDVVLCIVMLLFVLTESVRFAFTEWDNATEARNLDYVITLVYTLDITVNFNTAVERLDGEILRLHYERWAIFVTYCKGWFLIDLASTIPFDMLMPTSALATIKLSKAIRFIKVVRIMRLLKLAKMAKLITKIFEEIEYRYNLDSIAGSKSWTYCTSVVLSAMFFLVESHFFTCILLRIATDNSSLEWTWSGTQINEWGPFRRYQISMCLVLDSLLTGNCFVGASLQWPSSGAAMVVRSAAAFLFYFQLALNLLFFFSRAQQDPVIQAMESRRSKLIKFLRRHGVASQVRNTADQELSQRIHRQGEDASVLFSDLSTTLRQKAKYATFYNFVERFKLLQEYPFDRDFAISTCECIELRYFNPGNKLVEPDVKLHSMIYLHQGRINVMHETDNVLLDLPQDSYIALEAIFAERLRFPTYTVEAITWCESWCLPRDAFDKALSRASAAKQQCIEMLRSKVQFVSDQWTLGGLEQLKLTTLQSEGLCQDFREEFSQLVSEQPKRNSVFEVSSEDLGVSLAYILSHFKPDLEDALGRDIGDDSFRDLRKEFWPKGSDTWPGFKSSQEKYCPRDHRLGCAIVDALEPEFRGMTTHFVSWCWDYGVLEVISSLQSWANQSRIRRHRRVFLWLCFFCNNQRVILFENSGSASDLLDFTFKRRLQSVVERGGRMIAILNTYKHPKYCGRIWCIFEAYHAVKSGLPIDIALPQAVQKELTEVLRSGRVDEIAQDIAAVDSKSAVAGNKDDETRIKKEIDDNIGSDTINLCVKGCLRECLAGAFGKTLKELELPRCVREVFNCIDSRSEGLIDLDDIRSAVYEDNDWLLQYLGISQDVLEDEDRASQQLGIRSAGVTKQLSRQSLASNNLDVAASASKEVEKEYWNASDLHLYLKTKYDDPEFAFVKLKDAVGENDTLREICYRVLQDLKQTQSALSQRMDNLTMLQSNFRHHTSYSL